MNVACISKLRNPCGPKKTGYMYGYKRYLSFGRLAAYVEQFKYVSDNDIVLEIGKARGFFILWPLRLESVTAQTLKRN